MDESLWTAILLVSLAGFVYFLPTIVAVCRRHPYKGMLFVDNIFLAATGIGWAILLVLSFYRHQPMQVEIVEPVRIRRG